jgi:hypothetical protein
MFQFSIDNKTFFVRPDGEKLKDLTQSIFDLKNRNYVAYNVYRVPKEYAMRPDLISKSVYNNSMYAEIILKYNGISNPFSINEGDIILIPDLDSAKQKIKTLGNGSEVDNDKKIRDSYKYIDPLKRPAKSDDLKKFDERITSIPEGALPPNISEEGSSPIIRRNGRIYYGEGVETCLKNGMSSSEFLTTVIKSRSNII